MRKKIKIKKSFFLIEILIGIGVALAVSISLFTLESKMTHAVQRAGTQLHMETAYNKALTTLIEQLALKEIPLASMEKSKTLEIDLSFLDWQASYKFHIKKSSPEPTPNVYLVDAEVTVTHPDVGSPKMTGTFSFCLSTKPKQGG